MLADGLKEMITDEQIQLMETEQLSPHFKTVNYFPGAGYCR